MSHYDANLFSLAWAFLLSYIVHCLRFLLSISSRWSFSSLLASCFLRSHRWDFSSLLFLTSSGFLSCLSDHSDCACCRCFPIFDGLFLISSKYIRDLGEDIKWSSYVRPLLWRSHLRVDTDPLDRVIQPTSFMTTGAIWHTLKEKSSHSSTWDELLLQPISTSVASACEIKLPPSRFHPNERNHQVVWISTTRSLYHPEDQALEKNDRSIAL